MANAYEIKKVLEDIIYHAYYGKVPEETYKRLTMFRVEIDNKVVKSFNGKYSPAERRIILNNLFRNQVNLVKTSIHELAHHGDHILNFQCGHSKSFYNVYEVLLHTALNMGFLTVADVADMVRDSRDYHKVQRMLERYVPSPIEYKKEEKRFVVRNCFTVKDILKENGFRYNSLSYTWEKVVPISEVDELTELLSSIDCSFEVQDGNTVTIEAQGILIAGEGSYDHRKELKAFGFRWNTEKKRWQKKIEMRNYKEEIENLSELMKLVVIKLEKSRR